VATKNSNRDIMALPFFGEKIHHFSNHWIARFNILVMGYYVAKFQ
jgi:hypothetical protein